MDRMDHAGVIAPPPLLYAVAFGLVVAVHLVWPMRLPAAALTLWLGGGLVVVGVACNLWGALSMLRARTAINPYRRASALVTGGAFRLSRNPLYLGLNAIFVGLSLVLNSLWGLLMLVPLLVVMHYGVIRREERHLEALFGDDYRAYRRRVRRYL